MNAEFYIYNNELWCMTAESNRVVTEQDTELISMMIERIREQYPEAYEALEKAYAKSRMNVPYFQFKIVNRFCRCNFGELDCTKEDITNNGFNFEKVTLRVRYFLQKAEERPVSDHDRAVHGERAGAHPDLAAQR